MTENNKETDANFHVRNPESIGIILKNVVNEIAAGVSLSDFLQIMTILKNRSSVAKSLYNIQTTDIINDNDQIIDKMCCETGIDAKYNEITKLINDSATNKKSLAWRPATGDCKMQLATYRKRSLIEKKQKLENEIEKQRSKRLLLKKTLDHKRSHIDSLLKHMDIAKTKLNRNSENYIE